jgi:hypothetical protein
LWLWMVSLASPCGRNRPMARHTAHALSTHWLAPVRLLGLL